MWFTFYNLQWNTDFHKSFNDAITYVLMLGASKKHCMCAGYKNCKFEQEWPACLITTCTSTSENTEWCNRQQCLCGNFFSSSGILNYWNVLFLAQRHHKYTAPQNVSNQQSWWMLWKHSTNMVFHFFSVSDWRKKAPVKKQQRFWRMAGDQGNYDNSIIINSSLEGLWKLHRHLDC